MSIFVQNTFTGLEKNILTPQIFLGPSLLYVLQPLRCFQILNLQELVENVIGTSTSTIQGIFIFKHETWRVLPHFAFQPIQDVMYSLVKTKEGREQHRITFL